MEANYLQDIFKRFGWLAGPEKAAQMAERTVLLFGCGGVGSFIMEALLRSGLGRLIIVDGDQVDITNLNRQLIADLDTVGMSKTEAAARRCQKINPRAEIIQKPIMYTAADYPDFFRNLSGTVDYAADAVDMVTAKLDIIQNARLKGIPVISAMGFGNKLDPTQIRIAPIEETSVCPLARVMRRELKARGIAGVPAAYSQELPRTPQRDEDSRSPGSCAFVPSAAGLAMAAYIIRDMLEL